jgi:hypothetical protein
VQLHGGVPSLRQQLRHCRVRTFVTCGTTHIIAERGIVSAQVAVSPLVGARGRLFLDVFGGAQAVLERARTLSRLLALTECNEHAALARRRARSDRFILMLRALDGAAVGASQREIASVLFGAERTERDWRDPGGHLRDMTRRLLRRARFMCERGYLRLLA